jgi:hypothetical protein
MYRSGAAKGREARQFCRPILAECQADPKAMQGCVARCARYYGPDEAKKCERDCNLARCRVYEPYEFCVSARTLFNTLECFESECRRDAVKCLKERCNLDSSGASVAQVIASSSR